MPAALVDATESLLTGPVALPPPMSAGWSRADHSRALPRADGVPRHQDTQPRSRAGQHPRPLQWTPSRPEPAQRCSPHRRW